MNYALNTANNHANNYLVKKQTSSLVKVLGFLFLFAGIAFFTLSLFLNVFFTSSDDIRGFWVLLTGWLGFIIFQFSWYANPLSLLAVLLMPRRPVVALLLCILAVTLASQAFSFNEIPAASGDEKIYIKEFGPGAYLWYASQWLILYSTVLNVILNAIQRGIATKDKASVV